MHETVAPEGAGVGVATGAGVEVGTPIVTDIATMSPVGQPRLVTTPW
jgi:IMP dehydrogenase/GMP reductase